MTPDQPQRTYTDLADLYDRQGQLRQRDWFLVLAADTAQAAGQPAEADRLLGRLLGLNPHHFLKPFRSFAEALQSPDVLGYVANLRRNYPPERAADLLHAEERKSSGGSANDEGTLRGPSRPASPQPPHKPTAAGSEPQVVYARVQGAPAAEPEPPPAPQTPAPRPPAHPPRRPPRPPPRPRRLPRSRPRRSASRRPPRSRGRRSAPPPPRTTSCRRPWCPNRNASAPRNRPPPPSRPPAPAPS